MIYILWLNCIYIYKIKRKFPSAFSFAYRETSKASSLFIFVNEHVKTYIQLQKYTILNRGGAHAHTQFGGGSKTVVFVQQTSPMFQPWQRAQSLREHHCVKKLYFWIMWETSHVGRTRHVPSWWVTEVKIKNQLWPHRGSSHCPANLPGSPAQAACCLFGSASSSFLIPSTTSLPGTHISLGWTSQCLGECLKKLCKAWLNTETSAPCLSCVQDEPQQIPSHLVALGVVTTLWHMERGQLPDQLSFPCLIS